MLAAVEQLQRLMVEDFRNRPSPGGWTRSAMQLDLLQLQWGGGDVTIGFLKERLAHELRNLMMRQEAMWSSESRDEAAAQLEARMTVSGTLPRDEGSGLGGPSVEQWNAVGRSSSEQ